MGTDTGTDTWGYVNEIDQLGLDSVTVQLNNFQQMIINWDFINEVVWSLDRVFTKTSKISTKNVPSK